MGNLTHIRWVTLPIWCCVPYASTKRLIMLALQIGPGSVRAICQRTGLSRKTVGLALLELDKAGDARPTHAERGVVWSACGVLPDTAVARAQLVAETGRTPPVRHRALTGQLGALLRSFLAQGPVRSDKMVLYGITERHIAEAGAVKLEDGRWGLP